MAATDDKKIVSLEEAKAQKTAEFNRTTYGEVIRANRIKMGLSQPDLAGILGTSKNYVSNWEVGRTRPDMNMIPAICRAIGISIALVGVSGALLLPYYTVSYSIGSTFSFKSFIIVVLGGKGSVLGALLGGLIVGVIEKIGGQMFSDTYAQMAVFVVFVLVLLFKPNGLLGEKEM